MDDSILQPTQQTPEAPKANNKPNKYLLPAVGLVVIVILIGAYFLFQPQTSTSQATQYIVNQTNAALQTHLSFTNKTGPFLTTSQTNILIPPSSTGLDYYEFYTPQSNVTNFLGFESEYGSLLQNITGYYEYSVTDHYYVSFTEDLFVVNNADNLSSDLNSSCGGFIKQYINFYPTTGSIGFNVVGSTYIKSSTNSTGTNNGMNYVYSSLTPGIHVTSGTPNQTNTFIAKNITIICGYKDGKFATAVTILSGQYGNSTLVRTVNQTALINYMSQDLT